jgi:GNAT superfamily N-acetyltransferase
LTITLTRVGWTDPRAEALRADMDVEMTSLYSSRTQAQGSETGDLITAVLAVDATDIITSVLAVDENGVAIGHAGLRLLANGKAEVRKVVVDPSARGRGVSKLLMAEIEVVARENELLDLVLQTGNLQVAAVALYEKLGYQAIALYGGYEVIPGALCYEKVLS